MPNKIKIEGDDVVWKRAVDAELDDLRLQLQTALRRIKYLEARVK